MHVLLTDRIFFVIFPPISSHANITAFVTLYSRIPNFRHFVYETARITIILPIISRSLKQVNAIAVNFCKIVSPKCLETTAAFSNLMFLLKYSAIGAWRHTMSFPKILSKATL